MFYIRDGKKRTSTGLTNRLDAENCLARYMARKDAPPNDPTISQLLDLRLIAVKGKAREKDTGYFHTPLHKKFGRLRPNELSIPLYKQYEDERKHVPAAFREEILELRSAFRLGGFDTKVLVVPKPRAPREKFLTRNQAQRIYAEMKSQHMRVFMVIATTTGHRAGAILGLTWDRVDLDRGFLDFNDPDIPVTNKKRASVPIEPWVVTALKDAKKFAQTPYVVEYMGKPCKSIKKAFARAAVRAELSWASPHVLKHSVISWLAEDMITEDQISDLTGTDMKTVKRVYRKFNPEYLRNVAKSLNTLQICNLSKNKETPENRKGLGFPRP
ncbi:MAG: hypothetical protein COB46_09440 [Rhodospirillaceae bacterium]|nr:MAG: hypothetical protein COB46_09440 [Rhodospirillaceae bacterium]